MNYTASQELIDILLRHGFIENTHIDWPDHIELLKERGEYDSGSIKRRFTKGRIVIMFDYINLYISYKRQQPFLREAYLPFYTLKTILFFLTRNSYDKEYILKHGSFNSFDKYVAETRNEESLMNHIQKNKFKMIKNNYQNFVFDV
ncbi:MAG: hypothetical protein HQ521_05940 [Bacteroidetes bacterium]|nr:hypothetical protein [Bacteroidota bacterium]